MYLTLISVFLFSVVMSAIIGFVIQLVINSLITSKATSPLVGAGVSVLTISFLNTLLLFGIWYVYALGIVLTLGLYYVLLQSSMNRNKE